MYVRVSLILQKKLPEHHKMNFSLLKYVEPEERGGKESKDKKGRLVTSAITDMQRYYMSTVEGSGCTV